MPYVLPDHYFYQLDPAAQDVARPIGVVHCRIIEATGVPRMDTWPNYADNFVEMYISHTRRHRTSIVEGKNPRFDDVFAMPLHSQEHQKLRFTLWDYDAFSPDDEIGRCDIAISDLQEGEAHDLWLDVENEGEKKQKEAKQGEGPTQYSMGDRALRALAKPVAGHSVKKTQLHVKVHWRRWSDEEQQVINAAVKHGIRRALETPEGGRLDPDVKEMLMAGDLQVTVKTCNRIKVHGFFKRPSV